MMRSFFSAKARPPQRRAPSGKVWPCPLPFSSLHARGANRRQRDVALKLALNFTVLSLNFLYGSQRHFAEVVPSFGNALNLEQWGLAFPLWSENGIAFLL